MSALEVLLVQSENDGVTTVEGAHKAFSHLPHSKEVMVMQEYQHGLYPYLDSCVDTAVTRYLLGEAPGERKTICAGHALPLDRPALASDATARPTSTYIDLEQARKTIDRFRERIVNR